MTSSNRPGDTSSTDGTRPHEEHIVVRPGSSGSRAAREDEQTVISNRPPLSPGSADGPVAIELGNFKPGDVLGHYEILSFVGGGGMGRVFLAQDTQLDRRVALKVLPRAQAGDAETVLRFRNEARSAARLDHENIARVFHVGEDQGFPYLVFEYVEGPTIRNLVEQRGPLPLTEAVSYTLQVADALAHVAGHGVVHRDIKPSNLIITEQGRVKVIDLGLARIQRMEEAATDLTASGVTLGTFDYISPEQARDPRLVDTRSDIYSLGCTFFYILTARPPFPEGTVLQKLLQHQGDKPPDIHDFRPELPDEVSRVLRKMLAKDPSHRYQTAMELVEELQLLAEQIGLRPLGPGQRVWVAPEKPRVPFFQRHLPWIAPVAALLCIVLALDYMPSATDSSAPLPEPSGPASTAREEFVPVLPGAEASLPAVTPGGPSVASRESHASEVSSTESRVPGTTTAGAPARPDTPGSLAADAGNNVPGAAAEDHKKHDPTPPLAGLGGPGLPEVLPGMDVSVDPALFPEGLIPSELRLPPPAASVTPTKGAGILTVGSGEPGGSDYPTLADACRAARTGDVIELCYNGRREGREERPIDLPSAKLTIRARRGFQPILVFRPDQDNPVEYHRSMFTSTGGELSLVNVAVEMDIPRELPGSRWVLWELGQGARLRLQQSSLTIRNPYGHDVAVFCTKPSPALDLVGTHETPDSLAPVEIELTDCVIRGQAVTLRAKALQPVRLQWTNGLLATSEWFLCTLGGDRIPAPDEIIDLQLKHLTARVDKGLCFLDNSGFTRSQLPVKIECSDSIILVSPPQGTLIEQFGAAPRNLEEWFTWTGDWNGYQGVTIFWRIEALSPDASTKLLEFEQWQQLWPGQEIHSRSGYVDVIASFDADRPTDSCDMDDFRLNDVSANWPRGGASDATDLGAAADRLPWMPAEPEPAPSPTELQQ